MSLKLRLLLITGGVILVAFVSITWINISAFQTVYLKSLTEQGVYLTELLRRQAQTQLQMTAGDRESLSRFALQLDELSSGVSAVKEVSIVAPNGAIVAHADITSLGKPSQPAPENLSWGEVLGPNLVRQSDRLTLFVPIIVAEAVVPDVYVRIDFDQDAVRKTIAGIWSKALVVMLAGLVFVFLINTMFFTRNFENPLMQLRDAFIEIGDGNLTLAIPKFRDQEFDLAARGLSGMLGNLRQIVQGMFSMSLDLNEASESLSREFKFLNKEAHRISGNLSETQTILNRLRQDVTVVNNQIEDLFLLAQETSSSILQIKGSIEEVDENTTTLHQTLDQTLERLGRITGDIQKIAVKHGQIESDTDNMASGISELAMSINEVGTNAAKNLAVAQVVNMRAQEGLGAVDATVNDIKDIRVAVEQVEARSLHLQQSSEAIEGILRVIHQVAEKTNLLALNAAIIAAQAGEHGRSFAVVAEEIRDLAHRVQASTRDIEKLVGRVQEETLAVGEQVRQTLEQVERGEIRVREARDKLEKIVESSREGDAMSQAISRAMDEQAQVSGNIAELTTKIQGLIHDVAKSSNSQAEQARELTRDGKQVSNLSTVVKKAIQEETEGARRVADSVERMMTSIKQISDATDRQSQESSQISEHTSENLLALQEAVRMIGSFDERLTKLRREAVELDRLLATFRA